MNTSVRNHRVTVKEIYTKKVEIKVSIDELEALDGKQGVEVMAKTEKDVIARARQLLDNTEINLSETEIL